MTSGAVVAAVDLGASGGRVIAGRVSPDGVTLHEVRRFGNEPVRAGGTLHWDVLRLYAQVTAGLRQAAADFPLASAGIDSWAVDYGLLDASGALIGNPVHYRDGRTDGVTAGVPADELYAVTGIQHLPFNTIYQLRAAAGSPALAAARTLLLIPDLLGYWLTGRAGAEVTNASTTALLDVSSRRWATGLMDRAGIPAGLFPALRQPGELIGPVTAGLGAGAEPLAAAGGGPLPLVAVGSHDTASAVAAVPADGPGFAYISSGTWSLVGLELDAPVLSAASQAANFTNEAGVDGTVRYLRNVSGLWLLQECQRHWGAGAGPVGSLLRAAAQVEPLRFVVDADDPVFLPPGDMPGADRRLAGQPGPPGARYPARVHPLRPRQPGHRLPARPARRPGAVRPPRGRGARRRRRRPQRPAVPAHRGRGRAAGAGRAGRGDRARQRAGAGPGAGRGARRAGRAAGAAAGRGRAAPLHARRAVPGLGPGRRPAGPAVTFTSQYQPARQHVSFHHQAL